MKPERQSTGFPHVSGPFVPPSYPGPETDCDDAIRELREIWPDTVDLAKEPGLLYRLHALLND